VACDRAGQLRSDLFTIHRWAQESSREDTWGGDVTTGHSPAWQLLLPDVTEKTPAAPSSWEVTFSMVNVYLFCNFSYGHNFKVTEKLSK
jgi:hypothetical protein